MDEELMSDADLWEAKVREGMPKEQATLYVRSRKKASAPQPTAPDGFTGTGSTRSFGGPEETSKLDRFLESGPVRAITQGGTFGFSDEIVAGLTSALPGSPSYEQLVSNERAALGAFRGRSPKTALAAELGGAIMTGGLAGGRWAGARGLSTGARAGRGAIAGGAAGAVSGAGVAEGGARPRLEGAAGGLLIGAGLGAALPVAPRTTGTVLGAGIGAAMNPESPGQGALAGAAAGYAGGSLLGGKLTGKPPAKLSGATAHANPIGPAAAEAGRVLSPPGVGDRGARKLLDALRAKGMTVADAQREAASMQATGEPVALTEVVGDPVRRVARAIRTIGGRGGQGVTDALETRAAGAEERAIGGMLERAGVARENIYATTDEMIQNRAAKAKPLYDRAYQAPPVKDKVVEEALQLPEFQKAYEAGRRIAAIERVPIPSIDEAVAGEGVPVQALDYMKRGLDAVIEKGGESGTGLDRTTARALRERLREVLNRVDELVPEYKAARGEFAGQSALIEAHDMGTGIFKMPVQQAEQLVEKMTASEREAFRKGAGEALAQRIESRATQDVTKRHAASTLDKKRLRLLFPDEASYNAYRDQLRVLGEEHASKRFVVDGSQTADKFAELHDLFETGVDFAAGGQLAPGTS